MGHLAQSRHPQQPGACMASPLSDNDRQALRARLVAARQALPDRLERAVELQNVLRVWLGSRPETRIGAYWPIKGEFDALPALDRWAEADEHRRIRLAGGVRPPRTAPLHVSGPRSAL